MKALLIHPRLAKLGGLESRLFNYTDYFLNLGWEVHIACRKANMKEVKPGVIVHQFPTPFASQFSKSYRFNKRLEKWKKPSFDFELSLGRTSIQKNILAPASHRGYMVALHKKTITKDDQMQIDMDIKGYSSSTHIFACSSMVKKELIELYNQPESKVHVLYPPFNSANHKRFSDVEKQKIRAEYNLDPSKIYHLFISASHERKGLPILINAFEKLKDSPHTLLIIGPNSNYSSSNVKSLGFFKDPRVVYALGDYLLHPAIYEPYGQIINEALHHQLPVVVSRNTGASEIIKPEYGIIASDYTTDNWVQLIKGLPHQTFHIPPTLMIDLGMDLATHMNRMLAANGIKIE